MLDLQDIADRWNRKAKHGEWARVLADPTSYVNEDSSYEKFKKILNRRLKSTWEKINSNKMLDVACGDAVMWDVLLKYAKLGNIYGIDFAREMIEKARERYPIGNFIVGDAADLARHFSESMRFGAITSRGVILSHLTPEYFLQILGAAYPFLDRKGFLMFDYLNKDWFEAKKKTVGKPLYTSSEITHLIRSSPFVLDCIENVSGRDPVVILTK